MPSKHWEKLTLLDSKKEQISEFVKKYSGTYLWLEYKDKNKLVVLADSDGDRFYFRDAITDAGYQIVYDTDATITAYFPSSRYINFNGRVLYFTRIPARQYSKAPHKQNCGFYDPLAYHKQAVPHLSSEAMLEAFHPTYYEFGYQKWNIGYAMSPEFAITLHPQSDDKQLLWYKLWPVAEVEGKTFKVVLEPLRQEVIDFVNRNKLEVSVG